MKKKIFIVFGAFVAILVALPIVGNGVVQKQIKERIELVQNYGIKTSKITKDSSYLVTTQHFEFLLEDTEKFIKYLKQYSDKQMPSYMNALMDGVVVGMDVKYSNIPMSDDIVVDIYPLELPKNVILELKKEDLPFYTYFDKFLKSKGILYRINYDLLRDEFDGYLKDIDENYKFKNGVDAHIVIKSAFFNGRGSLMAPRRFKTDIKQFSFIANKGIENIKIQLNKLTTSSNFDSKNTYLTGMTLAKMDFIVSENMQNYEFNIKNAKFNASSISLDKTAEVSSKSSFGLLEIRSKVVDMDIKDLNLDIGISSIDKKSFEEFEKFLSLAKTDNSYMMQKMLNDSFINMISKGIDIQIADFSVKNILLDSPKKDYKGYTLTSEINIHKDKDLASKVTFSPLLALANLDMKTDIKFAKPLFDKMINSNKAFYNLKSFANIDGDKVLFDILFSKGNLSINGKILN